MRRMLRGAGGKKALCDGVEHSQVAVDQLDLPLSPRLGHARTWEPLGQDLVIADLDQNKGILCSERVRPAMSAHARDRHQLSITDDRPDRWEDAFRHRLGGPAQGKAQLGAGVLWPWEA